jgi:hypothetical protein
VRIPPMQEVKEGFGKQCRELGSTHDTKPRGPHAPMKIEP